ncbi:16138_t:CDS:2, partial [Dentiscutata erythropus]
LIYTTQFANEFSVELADPVESNFTTALVDRLKIKPTTFKEWKQRHYLTGYLNNNQKVKVYITRNVGWDDVLGPKYRNEILVKCDIPCIWKEGHLDQVEPKELKTNLRHIIRSFMIKPTFLIYVQHSDIPTSYVRPDFESWRTQQPFNITKLSQNSTFISFITSHRTEFRETWVPTLQAYIPVASFGSFLPNTPWETHPECMNLEHFKAKNCIISKYPFYLSVENSQEKDYSTEKLWDPFYLGVVPVIWGAPNTRSYLPHPKSAIFIDDYPNVEALANHLKYLVKNKTAYLEYHAWRAMNFSDGFKFIHQYCCEI